MSPTLVLGLGGALAGDDSIGLLLARLLAADPRRPPDVEAAEGGADLLRLGSLLAGRKRVVLVDAIAARPGETEPLIADHPLSGIDTRQVHAHQLSAVQALDLLCLLDPELAPTRFTWFLVPVHNVGPSPDLSPDLAARIPDLLDRLVNSL